MKQRGFTLLEILVVLGIMGLIIPLLAGTIRQLTVQSRDNTTRVTALVGLEDGGRWLGRDIPQAQATSLAVGGSVTLSDVNTFSLQWTNWADDNQYDYYSDPIYQRTRVTYSIVGGNLQRLVEVCTNWDVIAGTCSVVWSTTSTAAAARKVTAITFTRSASPGYLFTVTVSAYPEGSGFPGDTNTYTFYGALLGSEEPV